MMRTLHIRPTARIKALAQVSRLIATAFLAFLIIGFTQTAHAALTDSLVGFWNFNEENGLRADTVGSSTLTDINGMTSTAGKMDNAAVLISPTYLTSPDSATLSTGDIDFTFAGWIYLNSKTPFQGIVSKWDTATTREYLIAYDNAADRFIFDVSSNGVAQTVISGTNSGALSTGTYYFVVAWHNSVSNTINIQVNNGTVNSTAHTTGVYDSPSALVIGRYQGVGSFNGRIDGLGMWKRVLTAQERTDLYNAGAGLDYPFITTTPSAPTGLTGKFVSSTDANLAWTIPSSGNSVITDYVIEYKLSSDSTWTTASDGVSAVPSATITGLTNGVNYDFRVSGVNAIGQGTPSTSTIIRSILLYDEFAGTTIDTTKWNEIDSEGSGGTSGKVQQNDTLTVANSNASSAWGLTALESTAMYYADDLEISAVMTRGSDQLIVYGDTSFTSLGTNAYVLDLTATNVLGLVWGNGALRTSVTCGTVTNGATYRMKLTATGYQIYKNDTLACTVTPNAIYLVDYKPISLQSATTASTFDDVTVVGPVPNPVAPDAPIIGTATAADGAAIVTFSAPVDNGNSPITSYTVTSTPGSVTATGASSPITITGLTNGVEYTFTVTATNIAGTSVASSASNAVTPVVPPAPGQVLALTAQGVNQQALLNWDASVTGGAANDYIVEYKPSASDTWQTFADGTNTLTKVIVDELENDLSYDFRVSAVNNAGTGQASDTASATPAAIGALAFVFTGESNSGGIGLNSDATAPELASRSSVQITNLTSGAFLYENLDIGTNNLRDHTGLEAYYANSHGFELQLANSTEANEFPDHSQVYLTKTGHGGSVISQWNEGGAYWTKFLQRTTAAKAQLPSDRQWVVWLSLGINDAIIATPTSTWKTAMVSHINKIKADLPGTIIILTQFQSMSGGLGYPTFNAVMDEIAAEEANVYVVSSAGAASRDSNHWSYSGLKTVASRMVDITNNTLGLIYPGMPTSLSATAGVEEATLSWNAPIADGGNAISDYRIEYKLSADAGWNVFADGTSTATSATVTGLDGAAYDFRVSAVSSSGVGNPSNTASATPTIAPDVTAPQISAVDASISNTSAIITWTTDEPAESLVEYGLTTSYGQSSTISSSLVTSHSVTLSGLSPSTLYYYRVTSVDDSLNSATSTMASFTTTATPSPTRVTTTGYYSPTVVCKPGHLFSTITGRPCTGTSIPVSPMPTSPRYNFSRSLSIGMTGPDVRALQIFLNAHGAPVATTGAGSPGAETMLYGSLTRAAVAKYQALNNIKPAVGFFGPITRAWVNTHQQ